MASSFRFSSPVLITVASLASAACGNAEIITPGTTTTATGGSTGARPGRGAAEVG